ncbi:hypothetical protein P280DRAFT_114643 [Massarina eburnea CBS 473.64]|uniref:GST N-terminal domain-containing protein n=1 Tax=Massarina eburnea CBS 473.64 TaxID=1395130 RepID=A0A6A6RST6_9PLEO|nr:hypothetical protein P280DRAFT_114643 [Massarina eburnea CBS 473.64]
MASTTGPKPHPPVILFGYDSSPFTNKVRLVLRLKGIAFSYIPIPSMLPRPLLTQTFALPYRKIPILALGRDIYCDTSLIIEALEHFFLPTAGYGTIYPACPGMSNWHYKGVARGLASFWTDRPLFRITTGLIPPSVWRTSFGTDRAQLIGHALDAEKLGRKRGVQLSALDLHLSVLEPGFGNGVDWALATKVPSLADVALYYQLRWGMDISAGKGLYDLTGGGARDARGDFVGVVFNRERFPGLWDWFRRFEEYLGSLPDREMRRSGDEEAWKNDLKATPLLKEEDMLVPVAVGRHAMLDGERGLVKGAVVSVAPDDTGRDNPTVGTLVGLGVEEVVVETVEKGEVDVRIHFPRLGFVVRRVDGGGSKL